MAVVERVASHAGQIFTFEDFCAMAKLSVPLKRTIPIAPLTKRSRDGSNGIKFFSNHVISLFL